MLDIQEYTVHAQCTRYYKYRTQQMIRGEKFFVVEIENYHSRENVHMVAAYFNNEPLWLLNYSS